MLGRKVLCLAVIFVLSGSVACGGEETPDVAVSPSPSPSPMPSPSPTPQMYVVQGGDTLWEIARQFNTTVEALAQANNIENPEVIHPGQELIIPMDGQ